MSEFDIGNVYSKIDPSSKRKTYYVAVDKLTLITRSDGKFGSFTTRKSAHALESGLSVRKLCKAWQIKVKELDDYMSVFFMPDEDALMRAARDKTATADEKKDLELEGSTDSDAD